MPNNNAGAAHSALSPSSAERWFNCSGSINLIATLPETAFKTSKYAAEGSVAHGLAEQFVTGQIDFLALTAKVGEHVMHDGHDIEITEDMVDGIMEYADAIVAVRKNMGTSRPMKIVENAEVRVHATTLDQELWGTADYLLYRKGHELHVFDFKYGKSIVEAEENPQGLIYIVAAQDTETGKAFDKIFFHIIQPRARHHEGSVRSWELPKGRIETFRTELFERVAATKDQKAKRTPGSWCRFCPALAYCPEAAGGVQAAAKTEFTKIPGPQSKEIGATFLPPVSVLRGEDVARALDWEESIDSWFEALRARALDELSRDAGAIPGYKLVEGKTNRVWGDEAVAETAFALLGEKRYSPRKLLSPAQMEKVAGKEEVAPLVVKPQGKLTVAKSTDKRQAVASPAQLAKDVFEEIPTSFGIKDENLFGDLAGTAPVPAPTKIWP